MARIFSNATNQKLVVAAPLPSSLLIGTGNFTIVAWIRRPVVVDNNDECIVGNRNWDGGTGWELKLKDATDGSVRFDVQSAITGRVRAEAIVPNFNDGNWHMLVGRRNTAVQVELWGDNSPLSINTSATTGTLDNGLPFTISGSPDKTDRAFDGWIAEVSLFKGLLSTDEMTEIYKRFSAEFRQPSAYFPLVGRFSPEIDVYGGNSASLVNAPTTGEHPRIIRFDEVEAPFGGEEQLVEGSVDGDSDLTAFLAADNPVSGIIDAQSLLQVYLCRCRGFYGEMFADGQLDGALSADTPIGGSIDSVLTLISDLTVVYHLASTLHGQSSIDGVFSAQTPISGLLPGLSALDGYLVAAGDLGGLLAGQGALDGYLRATLPISGAFAGLSTLDATLLRDRLLEANLPGTSALSATPIIQLALQGILPEDSIITGGLVLQLGLAGLTPAASALAAKLSAVYAMGGSVDELGGLDAFLRADVPVAGGFGGFSQLDGYLQRGFGVGGTISGASTLLADLFVLARLIGSIDADGELVSALTIALGLDGSVDGIGEFFGKIFIPGRIDTTSVGGRVRVVGGVGGQIRRRQ